MISKIFKYYQCCFSENIELIDEHYIKCQTCKSIYYNNQVAALCVIVRNQEKRLAHHKEKKYPFKNSWNLPRGFVDHNEDKAPTQTAIRELKEETGLTYPSKLATLFQHCPR